MGSFKIRVLFRKRSNGAVLQQIWGSSRGLLKLIFWPPLSKLEVGGVAGDALCRFQWRPLRLNISSSAFIKVFTMFLQHLYKRPMYPSGPVPFSLELP